MMASAELRFYEDLNDFLAPALRWRAFTHAFDRRTSIKDMIESFGVPHTEIDIILVNGHSVDFGYIVEDGDHISVYPVFERLDVTPLVRLRPAPLRTSAFIIDSNLGRLARYLRLLGFDCLYRNDFDDDTIAGLASREARIVLTRDRALLQRKLITRGYFVRAVDPRQQVREVHARHDLYRQEKPFNRRTPSNGTQPEEEKKEIAARREQKKKHNKETKRKRNRDRTN